MDSLGFPTAVYQYIGGEWFKAKNVGEETQESDDSLIIPFKAGDGLFVQGASTTESIQSSGKVVYEDVQIQLRDGFSMIGNPFPLPIKLLDILVKGDNVNQFGKIQIQELDSLGFPTAVYQYIGGEWFKAKDIGEDASKEVDLSSVEFQPGQGLWIQGSSDEGQYLYIPCPIPPVQK